MDSAAHSAQKGSKNMKKQLRSPKVSQTMRLFSILLAAVTLLSPSGLLAGPLPTGGRVVKGRVNISTNGNTMTMDQSTNKAVVNWDSFDIDAGYAVNVNQPSVTAAMLARVVEIGRAHV